MTINEEFERVRNGKSDIFEHMPTLKEYASRVEHITEFGVRTGRSTIALLAGKPQIMHSYDIDGQTFGNNELYTKLAKEQGTDFKFIIADDRKVEIEETDLLFIDTNHTYEQLNTELSLHANKVRRYIILHDTAVPPWNGACDSPGMWVAVGNLLSKGEWYVHKVFTNNNGLTVLARRKNYNAEWREDFGMEFRE
jgi:hypothetical protein